MVGNIVGVRLRPELGKGKITKIFQLKNEPFQGNNLISRKTKKKKSTKSEIIEKFQVDLQMYLAKPLLKDEIYHYIWCLGEKVKFQDGTVENIGEILSQNLLSPSGIIQYTVLTQENEQKVIDEFQIIDTLGNPLEEFLKNQLDRPEKFLMRLWSTQMNDLYECNSLKIITQSRLSLLPHQIGVAHRLLQLNEVRIILADEVGLGKTIEAGIFIKEMIARKLATRILIITPASITGQWEFEMNNKFNLSFTRLDSHLMKHIKVNPKTGNLSNSSDGNEYPLCTITLQYARLAKCAEILNEIEWDIVLFDEAHHLRRYLSNQKNEIYSSTLAYELAEKLAQKTRHLLLLTATPIQLHSFDLYSLIQLLYPLEFPTFDSFEIARKTIPLLNLTIKNLKDFTRLNSYERKALPSQILSFNSDISESEIEEKVRFQPWREELIKKLENKHFLSKFIIRNRKRIVFPDQRIKRIPHVIQVKLTPEEFAVYEKIHLYLARVYSQSYDSGSTAQGFIMVILQKLLTSSVPAILKSLQKRIQYLEENHDTLLKLNSEQEILREFTDEESTLDASWGFEEFDLEDRLLIQDRFRKMSGIKKSSVLNFKDHIQILVGFVDDLKQLTKDSKATQLLLIVQKILKTDPTEKIIIFTQFKETLYYLASLLAQSGIKIAEFHGDLNEEQKNQSVNAFRHEVSILLSTEIGGEGRNFQFCHIIINYDLPWNPMRLEQRIGRLDRIGQTRDVLIYNFYIENTVESSIITAIAERIHLFEESIGALEPILGNLERQITDLILKEDNSPLKFRLEEVIDKTANKIEDVYTKLDDMILDKKSFQYDYLSDDIDRPDSITGIDILSYFQLCSKTLSLLQDDKSNNDNYQMNIQLVSKNQEIGVWQIHISDKFRDLIRAPKILYEGVFDLDLARTQEEEEFFALGHPLLQKLIEWCQGDRFNGFACFLPVNGAKWASYFLSPYAIRLSANEISTFQKVLHNQTGLNLFIFEIEFFGIIVEKSVIPILITDENEELPHLAKFLIRPHNFAQILEYSQFNNDLLHIEKDHSQIPNRKDLQINFDIARQATKIWIQTRLIQLTEINKSKYTQQRALILKIADQKKKYAEQQIKNILNKLRVKKLKLPTEKQKENINNIADEAKRKHRYAEIAKVQEEIQYYETEKKRWESVLNDVDFDVPEQLKRIERYKKLIVNANFIGYARLKII